MIEGCVAASHMDKRTGVLCSQLRAVNWSGVCDLHQSETVLKSGA
jgi:hypothetical protein